MHWSDVIAAPSTRQLRQFAATAVVLLSALTVRRWWHGTVDDGTWGLAALAAMFAIAGVAKPVLLRWVFTGAMVLAFPVGWGAQQGGAAADFLRLLHAARAGV